MVGGSLRVLRLLPSLKTGRHDIAEILLKVALSTKNQLINQSLARDSDYDIEPSLIQYHHKQNEPVTVRISNVATKTINIPPKTLICELQLVSVQAGSEQPTEKEISDIMSLTEVIKFDLDDQ